jgi:hypothetical protein
MVGPAALAHGVFLQQAPAGRGLARVENLDGQPRDCLDVAAGERGDAAEPLQKVQRGAFGSQQRAQGAMQAGQRLPRLHGSAIGQRRGERQAGVHRRANQRDHGQAREDPGHAGDEVGCAGLLGGDQGGASAVAGWPEILGPGPAAPAFARPAVRRGARLMGLFFPADVLERVANRRGELLVVAFDLLGVVGQVLGRPAAPRSLARSVPLSAPCLTFISSFSLVTSAANFLATSSLFSGSTRPRAVAAFGPNLGVLIR